MNLNTLVPKMETTNISKYLLAHGFSKHRAMEISYGVQTGSYEKATLENIEKFLQLAEKRANLINKYISPGCSILDCGCGELTTLALESRHIKEECDMYAFDISLNRILHGVHFYQRHGSSAVNLHPFCADMSNIPLPDSCVDIVKTVHALEPNGGNETQLLKELFRVSKKYIILFEPCFEEELPEFKKHMNFHGYVKNLKEEIKGLGGTLLEDFIFHDNHEHHPVGKPAPNTHCFVVQVTKEESHTPDFICPISSVKLKQYDSNCMSGGGYVYNQISGIPVLRQNNGIIFIEK